MQLQKSSTPESAPPSEVPLYIPPRNQAVIDPDFNFLHPVAPTPVQDTTIDETLIDALRNPRERLNALQFERKIHDFVLSQ